MERWISDGLNFCLVATFLGIRSFLECVRALLCGKQSLSAIFVMSFTSVAIAAVFADLRFLAVGVVSW